MKCLLVDDLQKNLLALSALLRETGVELLTAQSGAEALELLLEHDVGLALIDVQMPEMDGFELAELMRGAARTREVPIIFVTAGAREQQRAFQGYDLGAVDFLYKPIEPLVLRSKVAVFQQLHRQKQELATQLEKLSETLRMNEMFMAILSHDLRNPLNAVIGGAELLLRTSQEPSVKRNAQRIQSSGQRMAALVNDILDLARWRVGNGISLDLKPTTLEQLVRRVVAEHEHLLDGRRILLSVEGDTRARLDEGRISQVVSNLLGNALQHGNGADVAIEVRAETPDTLSLTISNHGAMPESVRASLFDPFRGRERTDTRGGLGLGLYIAQQVVLAHGGEISLLPEPGVDRTTFRVLLPRQIDAPPLHGT